MARYEASFVGPEIHSMTNFSELAFLLVGWLSTAQTLLSRASSSSPTAFATANDLSGDAVVLMFGETALVVNSETAVSGVESIIEFTRKHP